MDILVLKPFLLSPSIYEPELKEKLRKVKAELKNKTEKMDLITAELTTREKIFFLSVKNTFFEEGDCSVENSNNISWFNKLILILAFIVISFAFLVIFDPFYGNQ